MILCDVNVLVHAFRSDVEDHRRYKAWLEGVINGPSAYGVATQVLAMMVRVCTHPKIFSRPSSLRDTLDFCRVLLGQPNATVISPGERHWKIFESVCEEFEATGDDVEKAWFTALAIESGCEWTTTDRNYGRFKTPG